MLIGTSARLAEISRIMRRVPQGSAKHGRAMAWLNRAVAAGDAFQGSWTLDRGMNIRHKLKKQETFRKHRVRFDRYNSYSGMVLPEVGNITACHWCR